MRPNEGARHFVSILQDLLLLMSGFELLNPVSLAKKGSYLIEGHDGEPIFVQYKHSHRERRLSMPSIQDFFQNMDSNSANRGVLFTTGAGFSKNAWRQAHYNNMTWPVFRRDIKFLNFSDIKQILEGVQISPYEDHSTIISAVSDLCRRMAKIVAQNPDALEEIEWRDLERMLATVFSEIGFKVHLTRPAKDGGKDIVLECQVAGYSRVYLVEVKHWRSRKRVGQKEISHFINVVAQERSDGGLFLATYGYSANAFEALTEIARHEVRFGEKSKIVSACQMYTRIGAGFWTMTKPLPELLFQGTL